MRTPEYESAPGGSSPVAWLSLQGSADGRSHSLHICVRIYSGVWHAVCGDECTVCAAACMPLPLTVSGSVLRCTQGKVTDGHTNLFCCGYTTLPNGRYQVFQRLPHQTAALPQVC